MTKSSAFNALLLALLLLGPGVSASWARGGGPGSGMGPGPFERLLFPPDLVMRHAGELGLDEKQRGAIIQEMQAMQSSIVPLQWELRGEAEKLRGLLEQPQIDEQTALAQAERVGGLEASLKRTHLALLIRIKNTLTEEQRVQLEEIRERRGRRRAHREGGPGER